MGKDEQIMSLKKIEGLIYLIRGQKVMLDRDLAELYSVETKQLKRAVTSVLIPDHFHLFNFHPAPTI